MVYPFCTFHVILSESAVCKRGQISLCDILYEIQTEESQNLTTTVIVKYIHVLDRSDLWQIFLVKLNRVCL